MRELSCLIALFAAAFFLVAMAAWIKIGRNPKSDLTAGGGGKPATKRLKRASALLTIALGLSGLAMVLAVIGWL